MPFVGFLNFVVISMRERMAGELVIVVCEFEFEFANVIQD